MSSLISLNHSPNAYLFPRSALLNGNELNYSPVSGRGLRKKEVKRGTLSFQQLGAESLRYSPMNSNLALPVGEMG